MLKINYETNFSFFLSLGKVHIVISTVKLNFVI